MEHINATELAALASETSLEAHRDLPRETLVALIQDPKRISYGAGQDRIDVPVRAINRVRETIATYIIDNWAAVSPLLTCPAKDPGGRSCFSCTDVQVAECALTNPKIAEQKDTPNMADLFTYRTREEWQAKLAEDETATKKELSDALKAGGIGMGSFISWGSEKRLEAVLEIQAKAGWAPGAAPKGKAAKTKTPAVTTVVEAAPASEPEAKKSGGANAIMAEVVALRAEVAELAAMMKDAHAMMKDAHYLIRLLIQGNDMMEVAENPEFIAKHFGEKVVTEVEDAGEGNE